MMIQTRTGSGKTGVTIALVNETEKFALNRIVKKYNIDIQERSLPTDADVEAIVTERLTGLLETRLRDRDALKTERSRRFIVLGRSLAENEDESAIIAMLLDDYYQKVLHEPAVPLNMKTNSPELPKNPAHHRSKKRRR